MARDSDGEGHFQSVADFAARRWNVRLRCPQCRHERVVSGGALWFLFHKRRWRDDLAQAPRRLWCSRCWISARKKYIPRFERTRDAPTGDDLPAPDDASWKALIKRYRD